jgi:hypothetical protein
LSRRAGILFLALSVLGLASYLWPAFRAPVVLWSDSALDLEWARRGVGIVSAVPPPTAGEAVQLHPVKPGYLLFLRVAQALAPAGRETRTVVVAQSLLLWLSIVSTSMFVSWRHGKAGIVFLAVLFLFLRLPAAVNAIMPEPIAAALFLPIAALCIDPPASPARLVSLGAAIGFLFWVRPNVGGIALVLALAALFAARRFSNAALAAAGFLVLFVSVLVVTRPDTDGERLRGLAHPIFFGSQDYYWSAAGLPLRGTPRELESQELDSAAANWQELLRGRGPDARRQLLWRATHGLMGTELSSAPFWSRLLAQFLILASLSLIFSAAVRGPERTLALLGGLLVLLLVGQNLLLGSSPRFALPFLPVLFLLAAVSGRKASFPIAGAMFAALLAASAAQADVLEMEWGRVESAGVKIRQPIPRGCLPDRGPVTLHVRIAPPLVPSTAHFEVRGPNAQVLYSSASDPNRTRPAISISIPQSVLDANARAPIELEFISFGNYDDLHYLLFPAISPPWRRGAMRDGSRDLSPTTGIPAGALDWWAHAGSD